MTASFLLFILILEAIVPSVHGWGLEGHALVVRLAESQLTPEASEWIKPLLPWFVFGNLTAVASWADDIIHDNSNHFDYINWQWTRALHYIDMPDWNCNYDPQRDCKNDICVDGALRNYSQRLIAADLDHIQHKEALMFLVHFAGDVHQPLHVSFAGDLGGNRVKGFFMNNSRETNLHSLWDSGLIHWRISHEFQSNFDLYYEYLYTLMRNQTPTIHNDDFKQWIIESATLVCQQVYFDETNVTMNASAIFHLGNIYYMKNIPVVEQRIIRGGQRLGSLLNRLAANRPKSPASSPEKLCWGTIALIVVIAIELVVVILVFIGTRMAKRLKEKTTLSFSNPFMK
ncbi:unnamed protein product [Rotaria socialis]|uniref:Aspergillus nuclease S(1) n=1 Tax=Rotaria socialis TaxID=392032 RepID=A0A821N7V1_9BILA|nr:unnamed protein product [Rotaria socialis]CAF3418065.1 unnamed protein product [Rotaria socialis]CAF3478285.1 unnamed protein product [Rotaria socialis]CAF4475310.1 unnamed protein product [Rotaria socialis]CAF4496171.1 unnamed protein product [Rotaria socialis]